MSVWQKPGDGIGDNTTEPFIPYKKGNKLENSALKYDDVNEEIISNQAIRSDLIAPTGSVAFEDTSVLSTNTDTLEIEDCVTQGLKELIASKYNDAGSTPPYYTEKGALVVVPIQTLQDHQSTSFTVVFNIPVNIHSRGVLVIPRNTGEGVVVIRDTDENGCILQTETKVTFGPETVDNEFELVFINRIKTNENQKVWVHYEGTAAAAGHNFVDDPIWGTNFVPYVKNFGHIFENKNLALEENIITQAERDKLADQSGINTGDITLASDDTTQEALGLSGQELSIDLVTVLTDGAMSSEDKIKLNNIVDNCTGNSWVSGLEVTEASPKDQTVNYTAGTYLICGILKTIASASNYDMENAYGSVNHYSGMVNEQHRFVLMYVDVDEVMKSIAGPIAEKNEVPDWPILPAESVAIALVEIRVDSSNNPKDIDNKRIDDQRQPASFNTDEFVSVSAEDTTTGHLIDKLSNNGAVQFSIENPGASEKVLANVNVQNDIYYAEDNTVDSTTSTTYVNKLSLTKTFPAGDYLIDVYYVWSQDSNSVNFMAEVTLDTVRLGEEHIQEISQKTSAQRNLAYRRFKVTLTAASHTIALNFATSSAAESSYIYDSSITVQKVNIL